jgi:anhydro-N-acetylmuramic acid kinase
LGATAPLYVGLMSGTSMDAIDCALIRSSPVGLELVATHAHEIPPETKKRIAEISHSGANEIERMGALDRDLGTLFANAALQLLALANVSTDEIRAIGSHGQTIRHRPPSATENKAQSFTLQIADANTIAELTGITTIADFRRRDIAAGGEGAPLAPAFHAAAFASPGINRAIVNIGGIANVTILEGDELRLGFDCGPGNTLLDQWVFRHRSQTCDYEGQWASTGKVNQKLLDLLLTHPYFTKTGPRSTGKEEFNLKWLDTCLATFNDLAPVDVQSTLVDLTSASISKSIADSGFKPAEIFVCGGGAHNVRLMQCLGERLAPVPVQSTSAIGIHPDWVEAATFAWLASRTLEGVAGNSPAVTGATGPRVLGGIYPAGRLEV